MRLHLLVFTMLISVLNAGCDFLQKKSPDYSTLSCTLAWERLADCTGEIGKENGDASIEAAVFSPDNKYVASVAQRGNDIIVWNSETGESIWEGSTDFSLKSVQFTPNNDHLLIGGRSRYLNIIDPVSGKPIKKLDAENNIECITISETEKYIAAGTEDGSIIIWRTSDYEKIKELTHDTQNVKRDVNTLCFTEKDEYLISGGFNSEIKFWDVKDDFAPVKNIEKGSGSVKSMSVSPDGRHLASSSTARSTDNPLDNALSIWDIKTGANIYTQHFDFGIEAVAYSPNGQFLLAGGTEGRDLKGPFAGFGNIYVYKINDKPEKPYLELVNKIKAFRAEYLQFSADGNKLLSSHEDGTIKMWDVTYISN